MRRYFIASVIAVAVTLGLVHPLANASPAAPAQPAAPDRPAAAPEQTEADAARLARQTGQPVEVASQTTETRQVLANPNGTFTLKSNQRAVRVNQDGTWKPIDTTLRRNPDGSLSPTAADQNVAFSGGGTAPMVTVRRGELALAFSWPTALPTPTVVGDTATYPAVLPGVDLQLRAHSDSYTQVLIVHDAKAAANPALTQLRLTATGTGLTLAVQPDGALSATDATGAEVLRGPRPVMWDSRHSDQLAPAPSATDIGTGRVTPIATGAAPSAASRGATATSVTDVTLAPDPAALTGPDVVYPLYIDPGMSSRKWNWIEVTSNGWAYYNVDQLAQVGLCKDWDGCGTPAWVARSYFQMDISPLWYRNNQAPAIWRAEFFATQVWAADHNCQGGQPTAIYESGGFDANTRWPGPAGLYLDTQGSNAGGPCPVANLRFNVWWGARHASDGHWASLVLGLEAGDETNKYQWKKFDNNPLLEVDYTFPPNNATGLRLSNEVKCNGTAITPDASPTLLATATDNNSPPLNPTLWHHVWTADDSRTISGRSGIRIASGTEGRWTIPDRLTDGDWKFRVYTDHAPDDGLHNSANEGFSGWYPFTVRATPPSQAPTIVSTMDYPGGYWGAPAGASGAIAVNANGATNIVGYTYSFLGAGTETVPNTADCAYNRKFGANGGWIPHNDIGPDWIPLPTGLSPGRHTVHIRSFDDAHNLSPESSHTFYVAPNIGQSTQRFEAENLTRSQPAGQNVVVEAVSDCCNIVWSGGKQINIWGNNVGQSYTLSFSTTVEADYQIAMGMTRSYNYGQFAFQIDGQPIGQQILTQTIGSFDGYSPRQFTTHQPLGIRHLAAGTHNLTFTSTGTNASSIQGRYAFGVDYIDLTRTTRFEAEDGAQLAVSVPDGQNVQPGPQTVCPCWNTPWSDGKQLLFSSSAENTSFSLTFQAPIEADYALGANLTKANDYGMLTFLLDDKPLLGTDTTPWDGYNPTVISVYKPLGGAHLTAGAHKITFRVVDTNPASINARYMAGVDYLSVVPINNVTAANLTAAMNSNGIGSDGTGADFDLAGASLSAQTLAAAGYAPGATATVNGATFTMPAARADGTDNVIAIGQTIPFPAGQQIKASAVGLLVAATCGATPTATGTITYTDNTTQNTPFGRVDDWTWMSTDIASFVLPYRNDGTTMNGAVRPRLLALFPPADPTKTLSSITLPNYGTSLVPGSCSPALHVLAIAPRPAVAGWVGAWSAQADTAKPAPGGGLADKTVRSVVHPTVTGASVRVRVVNPTNAPVTIDAASLGAQSGAGAACLAAPVAIRFGGNNGVTLPAAGEAISDPVAYPTTSGGSGNLIVSLHLPTAVTVAPIHVLANAPTFLASGNATTDSSGAPFSTNLAGSSYLSGLEVSTSDTTQGTVAVLGDQLTAVAPPGNNYRPTWVDHLPAKLPIPGGLVNASLAGLPPASRWKLDDGSGTTARDSAGTMPATTSGTVGWSTDHGGSVTLSGNGSLATSGPVVGTTNSFTVSAWVKLGGTSVFPQTVVSQDGGQGSAFALVYTGSMANKWAFYMHSSTGAASASVLSASPAKVGSWTHLFGVYNATSRLAELYVNGDFQGYATHPSAFAATGPLAIGRGKTGSAPDMFLNGSVSDVRVYERAGDGWGAKILYKGGNVTGPEPGLGAPTAADASRMLDRSVLNQPRLRTVIVALGANDLLAGSSTTSIQMELKELMHFEPNSATGIRNSRRADGTRIHVIVTTVPALGLADNDPREQRRRQLNAELVSNFRNYGADELVDIAAAVQDPAHPNQINPAYLTTGQPNNAYHDAIAQVIADAANRFPPEAEL